jgi:hypothetical protein
MVPSFDPNRFSGQVDFRVSESHANWRVMTVIDTAYDQKFVEGLSANHLFDKFRMETRQVGSGDRAAVIFYPTAKDNDVRINARRKLLGYLTRLKYPIVWKEAGYGYDITKSGRIHRSWKLNKVL